MQLSNSTNTCSISTTDRTSLPRFHSRSSTQVVSRKHSWPKTPPWTTKRTLRSNCWLCCKHWYRRKKVKKSIWNRLRPISSKVAKAWPQPPCTAAAALTTATWCRRLTRCTSSTTTWTDDRIMESTMRWKATSWGPPTRTFGDSNFSTTCSSLLQVVLMRKLTRKIKTLTHESTDADAAIFTQLELLSFKNLFLLILFI